MGPAKVSSRVIKKRLKSTRDRMEQHILDINAGTQQS
jgi:hypothetical protein